MEYLGGGEVKWRTNYNQPVLAVAQTRRIIRDAVLGLEYRTPFRFYRSLGDIELRPSQSILRG